jgi:kumamolisin
MAVALARIALLALLTLLTACAPWEHQPVRAPTSAAHGRASATPNAGPLGPLGPLDPSSMLDVSFVLRSRGDLGSAAAGASDPRSPSYHHYLTPAQIAQQYGASLADVARVEAVLRGAEMTVTPPQPGDLLLGARGTAGQLDALLDVHLLRYRLASGKIAIAPDTTLHIPAVFGGAVTGVLGLDTRATLHTGAMLAPMAPQQAPAPAGYTPTDLASAYDLGPLHSGGLDGSKQTIALAEIDTFSPADVQSFDQQFSIQAGPLQVIKVQGGASSRSPEPALDIEVVHAIAPRASILVYESPEDLLSVARMLSQVVTDNRAQVLSVSLGVCERGLDPSISRTFLSTLNNTFQRAAAQGMSVLVASGDNGAYDCQSNTLSVGAVAANPNVTAVGGTALFLGSTSRYDHEAGWEGPLEEAGSGGGVSVLYARPSWQTGPGVSNQYSDGARQVPDVSADADPDTGYLIYYTTSKCQGDCWQLMGGTSAATPLWASIVLLANQQAQVHGKPPMGFLNPALYRLGASAAAAQVYHDITLGGNLYYQAATAWDYATGWGSPDGARLVSGLVALV